MDQHVQVQVQVQSNAKRSSGKIVDKLSWRYLLASSLLSGIIYRLGMFAGCAPSWTTSIQVADSSFLAPNVQYGHDDDDSGSPSHFDTNDRRSIPRTNLPYDCGVVFFYHIPCTGGASINQWLKKYEKPEFGNISYYQWQDKMILEGGLFEPDPEAGEAIFAKGMSEHIQNLGPNEWRIAHSHRLSTYLNESEDLLNKWRSDVEAQGCELINTVMLRDPLNHAMSLYKTVSLKNKNTTRDQWTDFLSSPTGDGLWATVLDFFLYNLHGLRYHEDYPNGPGGRNPFNVTKEVKVKRAMELLHKYFDIVTVADHASFQAKIMNWTGWTHINMPYMNVGKKELTFTKKEVESLQKLMLKNGDVEFVDQARMEYHDYLSYLNL